MLETLITSKTRIRLLLKFFSNPVNRTYLRSIASEFGESTHSIRLELQRLSTAGILKEQKQGNKITYSANDRHPLFPEIKSIVRKYLGLDQVVEKVLRKLGNIEKAFVVGDYALGKDTGTIQLWIVGSPNKQYLDELTSKVEIIIHRKIQTLILAPGQWEALTAEIEQTAYLQIWGNEFEETAFK